MLKLSLIAFLVFSTCKSASHDSELESKAIKTNQNDLILNRNCNFKKSMLELDTERVHNYRDKNAPGGVDGNEPNFTVQTINYATSARPTTVQRARTVGLPRAFQQMGYSDDTYYYGIRRGSDDFFAIVVFPGGSKVKGELYKKGEPYQNQDQWMLVEVVDCTRSIR